MVFFAGRRSTYFSHGFPVWGMDAIFFKNRFKKAHIPAKSWTKRE